MKILKLVAVVLGLVGLVIAGIYLGRIFLDLQTIMGAANTGRSANVLASPMPFIGLVAGLASLGGLLLGLGIGLPSRTRGAIRRQALQDASDLREASIRRRVGGPDSAEPTDTTDTGPTDPPEDGSGGSNVAKQEYR